MQAVQRYWIALPREARETLLMLGFVLAAVAPLLANVPAWCTGMVMLTLFYRGWSAATLRPLPPRPVLIALLIIGLALTAWSHRFVLGKASGVTMIVLLLALKTLELRARRDVWVLLLFGFFVLNANFLYSQSLATTAWALLALLLILVALTGTQAPSGEFPLKPRVLYCLRLVAFGAPMMLALFVLFPRAVGPLWGTPGEGVGGDAVTGLSESMRPGSLAKLVGDDSIVFRARFEGEELPVPAQLYWRGPVLGAWDGITWRHLDDSQSNYPLPVNLRVQGRPVRYTVTLEPQSRPWLFAMQLPASAPALEGIRTFITTDQQIITDKPIVERVRYQVESYPDFAYGPQQEVPGLGRYLFVPPTGNPRTRELAQRYREAAESFAKQQTQTGSNLTREELNQIGFEHAAQLVFDYLRTNRFEYSVDPFDYGAQSIDGFLFDVRTGFCEHYAQAMTVLLRMIGIPARVVTGYLGGEINPVDGFLEVRQADAHAWLEYWVPQRGWVQADPTAVAFPSRISTQRLRNLGNRGGFAEAVGNRVPMLGQVLARARASIDALNNLWNQSVIQYNLGKQTQLLNRLGLSESVITRTSLFIFALVGVVLLISLVVWWSERRGRRHDRLTRLLDEAYADLRERGLVVARSHSLRQLAALVQQSAWAQDLRERVHVWLMRLEHLRYRDYERFDAERLNANIVQLRRDWRTLRRGLGRLS